jgi:tetratricopeptide (TPR) repeat protein
MAVAFGVMWARRPATQVVLAVGALDSATGDSVLPTRVLRSLLTSALARMTGVRVVSHERIQELLGHVGAADTGSAIATAAQRAGATHVLQGVLSMGASGGAMRLDVREVELDGGRIGGTYTVEGRDMFELADRLTARIAQARGIEPPRQPISEVTSISIAARSLYEEGVRAYYQAQFPQAFRLFERALEIDSTFAMAAHYAARTAQLIRGDSAALRLAALAVRMSQRAPERERMLAKLAWAEFANDADLLSLADSLATRYPLEPEADLWRARALGWAGDFSRALPFLRRVADRELATARAYGLISDSLTCAGCVALGTLVTTYIAMDSLPAAERAAREWIAARPTYFGGWVALSNVLELRGHLTEALKARQNATRFLGRDVADATYRATLAIRGGEYETAERLLAVRLEDGDPAVRWEALWFLVISLRQQGRLRDALQAIERVPHWRQQQAHAQVLFEMGRWQESAAINTRLATSDYRPRWTPPDSTGLSARRRIWHLTLAASAYAAAGDTATLAKLVDTLARLGPRSAYGRDQRLHHHVRGLLLVARGNYDDAERELRRAINSSTTGFTRTNHELAHVLMARGKARQAIAVLQPALRGDLQSSNYYVSRTELHEALARAFDTAGQRDSAIVHYDIVARAWRRADPQFHARAARARERLLALRPTRG